jgi:hypothetical protein
MTMVRLSRAFFAVQHVGACISALRRSGETAAMLEIVPSKTI